MFKELKNVFYIIVIFIFIFFVTNYYFSDKHKKKSYRSLVNLDKKIDIYAKNLPLLKNDTNNIVEYAEKKVDKNKKNYSFWTLINNNE